MRAKQASIVTSGEHWTVDLSKALGSGERDRKTMSCSVREYGSMTTDEALDESKNRWVKLAARERWKKDLREMVRK